uniref:Uncharacterized protein n=1 Tax=Monopterus albus TaxID=43700 RepID=A0A3Q3IWR3_MONAL
MPSSNTGHLPQSLVSLSGELLCVPAAPTTPGDTNDINHLILGEDGRDGHSLLQAFLCPLHLHDVGFLLLNGQQSHLKTENKNLGKFLHLSKILVQLFLSCLILPLLTVLGENIPVFVESAFALITEMGCFNDGLCLSSVPAVHTEAYAVHLPEGVGHASLVSQEGGEVDRLTGVIFGPCAHPPPVLLASFVGQKPHVSMSGRMEFAMRLKKDKTST